MPSCICAQYRPLHPDVETVLNEKSKAISDLIKEHVAMREQIHIARGRLLYGLSENGLDKELCKDTIERMDNIQKGINNADKAQGGDTH